VMIVDRSLLFVVVEQKSSTRYWVISRRHNQHLGRLIT